MVEKITLDDMQRHSGLSERTLHSYIQKGLIPGPEKAGRYAHYSEDHLHILELIATLKNLHLPLKKIKMVTENLSQKQIRWLNKGDYLSNLKIPKFESDIPDDNERSINYIVKLEIANKILDKLLNQNTKSVDNSDNYELMKFRSHLDYDDLIMGYQSEIWHHFYLHEEFEIKIKLTDKKSNKHELVEILSFLKKLDVSKD